MDTIVDPYGHAILTLTERPTNFMLMAGLGHGRKAAPTAREAIRLLFPYREKVRTITTDNGCEFATHLDFTRGLAMKGWEPVIVYFADSYCSWQKGPPRTRTSSSGGTSPNRPISTISLTVGLRRYSTN